MKFRKLFLPLALATLTLSVCLRCAPKMPRARRSKPPTRAPASSTSTRPRPNSLNDCRDWADCAQAIVNFRKTHPFKRIEDLQRIKGLGKRPGIGCVRCWH